MENLKDRADFHVHLGQRTNEDLLDEAEANGVGVVGVLDRGIIKTQRLKQLVNDGRGRNINIVPGIESLTDVNLLSENKLIEIVGLGFSLDNFNLYQVFDPKGLTYSAKHRTKVDFQRDFLGDLGIDLPFDESTEQLWYEIESGEELETAIRFCEIAASSEENRPLIEKLMADLPEEGVRQKEARVLYDSFFGIKGEVKAPGYRRWSLDFNTIIDTIHQAGGVAIAAHDRLPFTNEPEKLWQSLEILFEMGLDGVEGWEAGPKDEFVSDIAKKHNKLVLGGSGQDTTRYDNRKMGWGETKNPNMFIPINKHHELIKYQEFIRRSRHG